MSCPFNEFDKLPIRWIARFDKSYILLIILLLQFLKQLFFKLFKEIVRFQLKSIWIDDLHQVGLYCNKFSDDRSRDLQSGKPRFHPEMKSEWRHRRRQVRLRNRSKVSDCSRNQIWEHLKKFRAEKCNLTYVISRFYSTGAGAWGHSANNLWR